METNWKTVADFNPIDGKFYYAYPCHAKGGVYALKYEDGMFYLGSYIPVHVTHFREIDYEKPTPPRS